MSAVRDVPRVVGIVGMGACTRAALSSTGDSYAMRRPPPILGQHNSELADGWVAASD